ncbi:phosphatase PAP2 family protein [Microbacterium sp. P5_E9]
MERRGLLVTAIAGIVAVVLLGIVILLLGNGPLPVDTWWHDLMVAWRTDAGLVVAEGLQLIGAGFWSVVIVTAIVAGCVFAGRPWSAATVVVAVLVSQAITGALKFSFARPRPEDSLSTDAMTAFPSGHTSMAATLAVVLALLIRARLATILAVVWIVAMAWSRTYLAAHWLSDVIAGAVLGAAVALLTWTTLDSMERAAESPLLMLPKTPAPR